jgi:PAN domain
LRAATARREHEGSRHPGYAPAFGTAAQATEIVRAGLASMQRRHYHRAPVGGGRAEPGHRMVRFAIALAAGLATALGGLQASHAQVGFDRRGGDYAGFPVRSGDPAICAARCDREARCRAWSFNFPAGERPAQCWLKSQVPPRIEDSGSASGVRGAGVIEPRHGTREFAVDRAGGDLHNFDVAADPAGETCKTACDGEPRCRAWTYVRPGYQGPNAHCYLKDRVMPPRHRPCCISGVER